MELSEFQKEYHWMYGLGEYFNHKSPDHAQRWDNIHKALFQNNWYRKRDILMELIAMDNSNPTHVKSWINLLAHEHLEEIQIKPQLVVTLMRKLMHEDPMLVSMARFINHFTSEDDTQAAHLPDLNDFLSKGQVQSKLWMADALKDIFDEDMGNVVFYGGWYNFFAHFLFEHFNVDNCYSLDLNMETVESSKKLYQHEHSKGKFHSYHANVSKIVWKNNMMNFNDLAPKEEKDKFKQSDKFDFNDIPINLVVNTSCEHMDNSWYENLPEGKVVVLQTNDYFSNPQHMNCCEDVAAAKVKYPMSKVFYEGTLDTHLYNRFMLIGQK